MVGNDIIIRTEIINFLELTDFEVIKHEARQLIPKKLFGVGRLINKYIGTLPLVKKLAIRNYIIARPLKGAFFDTKRPSTSIIVPCRNEMGNIENIIKRIPKFCDNLEIILVEGHSKYGTLKEINLIENMLVNNNIKSTKFIGENS